MGMRDKAILLLGILWSARVLHSLLHRNEVFLQYLKEPVFDTSSSLNTTVVVDHYGLHHSNDSRSSRETPASNRLNNNASHHNITRMTSYHNESNFTTQVSSPFNTSYNNSSVVSSHYNNSNSTTKISSPLFSTPTMTMNKRGALWLGAYPLKSLSSNTIQKTDRRLSIVISHCEKPLYWIQEYIHDAVQEFGMVVESVTIVSKCGKPVVGAMPRSRILRLPNVGRCDHTYAQWMANMTEKWTSIQQPVLTNRGSSHLASRQMQLRQGNRSNNDTSIQRRTLLASEESNVPPPTRHDNEHEIHVDTKAEDEDDRDNNHFVLFIKDNDYRAESHHYRSFRQVLEIVAGQSRFACIEPPIQLTRRSMSMYHNYTELRTFEMSSYRGTQKQGQQQQRERKKRPPLYPTASNLIEWLDAHGLDEHGKKKIAPPANATNETSTAPASTPQLPIVYEFKSNYSNLGEWIDVLDLERHLLQGALLQHSSTDAVYPSVIPVCYGGIFATTKHQILKAATVGRQDPEGNSKRSSVFHRLTDSLARQDNIEEGHFAERIWAALLSNPLNWELVLQDVQNQSSKNENLKAPQLKESTSLRKTRTDDKALMENHGSLDDFVTTIHWKDLFAPHTVESRCSGNFAPICGIQAMSMNDFLKMSNQSAVETTIFS